MLERETVQYVWHHILGTLDFIRAILFKYHKLKAICLNLLQITSTNVTGLVFVKYVCWNLKMANFKLGLDVLLCTDLSKDTTCNVCAAIRAGIPLIIFHPGRMQMRGKTNVKFIKSFIKHLEFRQHQRACRSPVQRPFRLGVTSYHASQQVLLHGWPLL